VRVSKRVSPEDPRREPYKPPEPAEKVTVRLRRARLASLRSSESAMCVYVAPSHRLGQARTIDCQVRACSKKPRKKAVTRGIGPLPHPPADRAGWPPICARRVAH